MDFIKLQKLKDTYFSNQTISQMMTTVFDAATDDPYYWSDDRLLEEIEKIGWKRTYCFLYPKSETIYQKSEIEDVKPLYDVNLLAKYIINTCIEDGHPITNAQLQFLLFRIQMNAIATGVLAFQENCVIWTHNIVVPCVWYEYAINTKNKIVIFKKSISPFKEGDEFKHIVDDEIRYYWDFKPQRDKDWRYFKSLNVNLSMDSEITITPKMMKDYILGKELRNE